ncbi:hypothetical protein MLD38_008434 [Melastoma candidum]|uniref:Uncharacterized protein n=1 Tax=Melastoma candidum TaxID=119954 RepID=A0ACB9RY15_9MYRT|nr:hypothetical protein MLD38_008434 [Melastoma candidum]
MAGCSGTSPKEGTTLKSTGKERRVRARAVALECLLAAPPLASQVMFWQEDAHEKVGVVDAQWVVHQHLPTLAIQVYERCHKEWGDVQPEAGRCRECVSTSSGVK